MGNVRERRRGGSSTHPNENSFCKLSLHHLKELKISLRQKAINQTDIQITSDVTGTIRHYY